MSITECRKCSFAWQYPLGRTEAQSTQFFASAYHDAGRTQSRYFLPDNKRDIAQLEFDFVTRLPGAGNHLLDVGAGAGFFAEVAALNNWEVTAVDPVLEVSRINANNNIRLVRGTLDDLASDLQFDVVTFWDVIEHTPRPIELITRAGEHLKAGGWLVIETGNFKSADRINGGLQHWMYQLDHRWYFSPSSMELLLRKVGFSEFVFSEKVLRPGWRGKTGYAGPGPRQRRELLHSVIRHPWRIRRDLSRYLGLLKARSWSMAGISIFAVAARKHA